MANIVPADGMLMVAEWFDYAVRRVPQLQSEALDQAQQHGRERRFDVAPSAVPIGAASKRRACSPGEMFSVSGSWLRR